EIPDFFLTRSTTSFPLEDSRIAEVAQALYLTTRCDFISNLKAFMVSTILSVFSTEILLERNTSVPKRMGTRTNEFFLNFVVLPSCSIILDMSNLTALEPISMAAYFLIDSILFL